ncbi:MAG: hypothetical protein GXO90_05380 [FCB group bacterium]|nr:hypothetical protein [FCB group bacterium]
MAIWIRQWVARLNLESLFLRKNRLTGNLLGTGLGILTPFCSCTTIPIFCGLVDEDVNLGFAMSFLFASPLINPIAIILMGALLGWKLALIYLLVSCSIAIVGGIVFWSPKWKVQLIEFLTFTNSSGSNSLRTINRQYFSFMKSLFPVLLLVGFVAAGLKSWFPIERWMSVFNMHQSLSLPITVGLGGLIYADILMLVPLAGELVKGGLNPGLVFGLLLAASGVGLPSIILLTRIFKFRLLIAYLFTLFLLIISASATVSWILG